MFLKWSTGVLLAGTASLGIITTAGASVITVKPDKVLQASMGFDYLITVNVTN